MDLADAPHDPHDPSVGPAGPPGEAGSATGVFPVDLRDWVRFDTGAAVHVRVMTSEMLALDLWCIEPQQATEALHLPDSDVTYTVLAGRSWFVTDEGEVGLDPLGSMLVPAGTAHGIDNRAPDPLIVLAVSSPPDDIPVSSPFEREGRAVRTERTGAVPLRDLLQRARRSVGRHD
jgi:mannose-6-phosphate isomerase-like protein (cupin superfamily)